MKTKLKMAMLALSLVASASYGTAYASSCGTGLDTTNVTFEGSASTDCKGPFSGNNSQENINTFDGGSLLFGGTNWGGELKDDGAPGTLNNVLGFNWTLSAGGDPNGGTSGIWTLTLTDANTNDLITLPIFVDFLVVLKGSTSWAGYLFDDQQITKTSNQGTFQIVFYTTPGGNGQPQIPGLSHMSLYLREGSGDDLPPERIPEPSAVALLGVGLLGMGMARKGRRQAA